jgi:hypothetical protein
MEGSHPSARQEMKTRVELLFFPCIVTSCGIQYVRRIINVNMHTEREREIE